MCGEYKLLTVSQNLLSWASTGCFTFRHYLDPTLSPNNETHKGYCDTPREFADDAIQYLWKENPLNRTKKQLEADGKTHVALHAGQMEMYFADSTELKEVLCQVKKQKDTSDDSGQAPIIPEWVFMTAVGLFVLCLIISYVRLRAIRKKEEQEKNDRMERLQAEINRRRNSRREI